MKPNVLIQRVFQLIRTLKFRVVVIGLAMTMVPTALTTLFAMQAASRGIEPLLMAAQAELVERIAANMDLNLEMRRHALTDFAVGLDSVSLADQATLTKHLRATPGIVHGFDLAGVSTAQGEMLAGLTSAMDMGQQVSRQLFFRRAIETGVVQISDSSGLRIEDEPSLAFAAPVRGAHGETLAVVWGIVRVRSGAMAGEAVSDNDTHEIFAIDRRGSVVVHPDSRRIGADAVQDEQLGPLYRHWVDEGTVRGRNTLLTGHDVIAYTGVPGADWLIVAITPISVAFAALDDARAAAWKIGALAALMSAVIAGLVMYWLTRPVELLRKRAHRLLTDHDDIESDWPELSGEVGDLARVFLHILRERSAVETSTMQLLMRLQAVLDNASVGIAFTRDGHFELTSRTFCSILGYEQYEMIGGPTRMLHRNEQEYAEFDARAQAALVETASFSSEVLLMRKDQDAFWAQLLGHQLEPGNPGAGTIWILEDVTEARAMREQLTWTATHDALTGLVNRREFDHRLKGLFSQVREQQFCALFLDLDRFKTVNDTAGHAAGDRLLCDLSHLLDQSVDNRGTVARLGGDEFAVLLPGCAESDAARTAEQIRHLVEDYRLRWDGKEYGVGASVGVVEVTDGFASVQDVLHAADAACYEAKRGGRNMVRVYRGEALVQVRRA